MRPRSFLWSTYCFAFLFFLLLVRAAPAEKDTTPSSLSIAPTSSTTSTTPTPQADTSPSEDATKSTQPTTRASGKSPDNDEKPSHSTSTHSIAILSATHAHHTPQTLGTRTGTPQYTKTHTWDPHPPHPSEAPLGAHTHTGHGQSTVAIVFEVIGGAVLFFILFSFGRCFYSYRKAPERDRIAALLNRHRLEREMEEMERDRVDRFRQMMESTSYQWRPPPPPYQQAPAYEAVVGSGSDGEGSVDWGHPSIPPRTHPPTP